MRGMLCPALLWFFQFFAESDYDLLGNVFNYRSECGRVTRLSRAKTSLADTNTNAVSRVNTIRSFMILCPLIWAVPRPL